ncbi:MAG TPA: transcriptional repressor LexA [Dehalococcoidia bacterium]|nr:transcriptional repressor LexA [Dehalococcoidia bacterium]
MKPLSPRQRRILEFIDTFTEEKGYSPSIRDIVNGCAISSTSVVDYNLRILERQHHLRRDPEVSRGIVRLGKVPRGKVTVPVLGQIAAGQPIPVPQADTWSTAQSAEQLELPQDLTKGRADVYALRVKGTSMIDALINDGDVVLMQAANTADNGEMVAVWLKQEQEVTLKKFYHEGKRIRLQPANSQMQPIYTAPDNVEIQGKVVGVMRQL